MHRISVPAGRGWPLLALVCAAALGAAQPAAAQSASLSADPPTPEAPPAPASPRTVDAEGHVVVHAMRIAHPIKIDGHLDEAAYGDIPPIAEFVQQEPNEGAPVSEKTEAWVLFDDENIYISCRCWDEHADRIVANDMRKDSQMKTVFSVVRLRRDILRRSSVGGIYTRRSASGDVELITDNNNVLQARELQGKFRTELHSSDTINVSYFRLYDVPPAPFLIS